MHISTIELAKVSKLLFAVDQGKAHEFAGKHMQDIDIDGIPGVTDAASPEDSEGSFDEELSVDRKLCKKSQTAKNDKPTVEDKDTSSDEEMQQMEVNEDSSFSELVTDAKGKGLRKRCRDNDSDDENWGDKKCRRTVVKVPWSSDEKEAVLTAMSTHIKKGSVPGKKECEQARASSNGILACRTWRQIKYCVKNTITTSRRIQSAQSVD